MKPQDPRAEERNRIREQDGLPPLSDDGMAVDGDYVHDPLRTGQCAWCGAYSEDLRACETCGEDRCGQCLRCQGQCCVGPLE